MYDWKSWYGTKVSKRYLKHDVQYCWWWLLLLMLVVRLHIYIYIHAYAHIICQWTDMTFWPLSDNFDPPHDQGIDAMQAARGFRNKFNRSIKEVGSLLFWKLCCSCVFWLLISYQRWFTMIPSPLQVVSVSESCFGAYKVAILGRFVRQTLEWSGTMAAGRRGRGSMDLCWAHFDAGIDSVDIYVLRGGVYRYIYIYTPSYVFGFYIWQYDHDRTIKWWSWSEDAWQFPRWRNCKTMQNRLISSWTYCAHCAPEKCWPETKITNINAGILTSKWLVVGW